MSDDRGASRSAPLNYLIACLLLPPLGVYLLWRRRHNLSKVQVAVAGTMCAISMMFISCTGLLGVSIAALYVVHDTGDVEVETEGYRVEAQHDLEPSERDPQAVRVAEAKQVGSKTVLASGPSSFAAARSSYMGSLNGEDLRNVKDVTYFFMGTTDMITGFKLPPEHERDAREAVVMFRADVQLPGQPSLQGDRQLSVNFERSGSGWRVTRRQVYFRDTWIDLTGDVSRLLPVGTFPK